MKFRRIKRRVEPEPESRMLKSGDQVWWVDKQGTVRIETVWQVTVDGELIETAGNSRKMTTRGLHRFKWTDDDQPRGARGIRAHDVVWWHDDWGIHIEHVREISTDGRLVELSLQRGGPPEYMLADDLRRLDWAPMPTPNCEEEVCPAPSRVIWAGFMEDHRPWKRELDLRTTDEKAQEDEVTRPG